VLIYQNDLEPDLEINLTDDGKVVPLNDATEIRVIGLRRGVEVFNRTATGDQLGHIVMPFQAGDTAEVGGISLEVIVTWAGARPQTFPITGTVVVRRRRSN